MHYEPCRVNEVFIIYVNNTNNNHKSEYVELIKTRRQVGVSQFWRQESLHGICFLTNETFVCLNADLLPG